MNMKADRQPVISLGGVGVFYWRRAGMLRRERYWVLRDVSFDLYHGETLGVIGRNGVGKSTLLRLLAGIIKPDCGQMKSGDFHATMLSLQLGFVPQLSGRENAILSAMLLGISRADALACMDGVIAFSELGSFIDQPVHTYSVGMKARLGFAVAFQVDPDIILIDEVLGVGDSEFQEKSATAMRQKIHSNKTVVLVSHSQAILKQLCDRVVWIEDGCVRAEGDVGEVLDRYRQHIDSTPRIFS